MRDDPHRGVRTCGGVAAGVCRPQPLHVPRAVVSDGDLDDLDPAQRLITTLHCSGCPVLWLRPDGPGHTFADTTTVTMTDPVQAIDHIAAAAVTALENA